MLLMEMSVARCAEGISALRESDCIGYNTELKNPAIVNAVIETIRLSKAKQPTHTAITMAMTFTLNASLPETFTRWYSLSLASAPRHENTPDNCALTGRQSHRTESQKEYR